MTNKFPFSASELAELEGDAIPFAAAPRFMLRKKVAVGNRAVAMSTVERAVLQALLESGYERGLAEEMAAQVADQVPVIEQKLVSAA
ncbi:MAG: hypothetical protein ACOZQL_07560 [Myxococcota bacterium]